MSFLSSLSIIHGLGACNLILYIHFFINLQLPQQYIRWPVSLPQKSHKCALKLTDLWITSLLFDVNYEFNNRSFTFSAG